MTLFRSLAFENITKLRWGQTGLGWALVQGLVEDWDTDTQREGEQCVTTGTEIGVMHL